MVNTCCAPKCKSGYATENKKDTEKLALFKFPGHEKEPQRRAEWISKVPRTCWKPREDANIYICELHFQEKDFIQNSVDTNNRRKRKKAADDTWVGDVLKRKRLTKDAFPSIWPGAPSHLSKISSPRNSNLSSSEARRKNVETMEEMAEIEEAEGEINSIY